MAYDIIAKNVPQIESDSSIYSDEEEIFEEKKMHSDHFEQASGVL